MRAPREAPPAFLFFGVITGFEEAFARVRGLIEAQCGSLRPEGVSAAYPFPETRTYARTMGPGLRRKFFVVDRPWPQDRLAQVKLAAIEMEEEVRRGGSFPVERPVNVDPGLLNDCRIVLASTKDYSHRIYRGSGIWEEVTLMYQDGGWKPLPWTYPDFRSPAYHEFFAGLRERLLAAMRTWRGSAQPLPPLPPLPPHPRPPPPLPT